MIVLKSEHESELWDYLSVFYVKFWFRHTFQNLRSPSRRLWVHI